MTFTKQLWQSIKQIYDNILCHPFNNELAQGTLALEKFQYYVQQDELYINAYSRALALLAAKSPTKSIAQDLLVYANDGLAVERALHDHFFKKFNITPTPEPQPACFSYTNFLLSTTAMEPFQVGIAALLPCFWIYRDIGHEISKQSATDNPYQLWIDTYVDAEYDRIVDRVIGITDLAAKSSSEGVKSKMQQAFIDSARLEFIFWDAAYRLEKWPH